MNIINKVIKFKHLDAILVFVLSLILFLALINFINTDIQTHIESILKVNSDKVSYPPHFLFFFLVNLFSFFSSNIPLMFFVTAILLSLATLAKYIISKRILLELVLDSKYKHKLRVIKIVSFGLLFCFAIPDVYNFFVLKLMYLGRYPSVVWHNSTTVFLFPFALLLFWKQYKLIHVEKIKLLDKDVIICSVLVALNISIKPSFVFVYIPVSVFFVLRYFVKSDIRKYIIQLIPVFVGMVLIAIQYVSIYHYQTGSLQAADSSVSLGMPFEFARNFIPSWYVPIAIIMSLVFPIVAIWYYRDILKFKPFLYSLYLLFFGMCISSIVIETGPRKFHGNFTWQNIICVYLLMLTTVAFLLPKVFIKERYSKKMIVLGGVFLAHFLSGILYLLKIYFTKSYY